MIDLAPTGASVILNAIPDEEPRRSANTAHLLATRPRGYPLGVGDGKTGERSLCLCSVRFELETLLA